MPQVSVVIPAYNAMKFLPATISSVLAQTYRDFEVLVINDGSSDNTAEWVTEQQQKDQRIKLISQENKGLAGARNTGIKNASAEYIAFLDADDLWDQTKLAKQVTCLAQNSQAGLVYNWVALIDEDGIVTGRLFKSNASGDIWQELTQTNFVGCGSVAMVHRCCFQKCGLFDENLGSYVEDWDMWLRIASDYNFAVIPEALVYYRQHSASASKNWEAMAKSYHLVIEKAFANAPQNLQYLKTKSYGNSYLRLAWKPIQSTVIDYQKAMILKKQAFQYHSQVIFTKEYWKLTVAILLIQLLGARDYNQILQFFYSLRRFCVEIGANLVSKNK